MVGEESELEKKMKLVVKKMKTKTNKEMVKTTMKRVLEIVSKTR